jgi:hypothetical protein
MSTPVLPKMMLGFVVRRCAVALGHAPTPAEFAAWANSQGEEGKPACLFGRPITEREAALILRHPARPVSARGAAPHEQIVDEALTAAPNVVSFERSARRHSEQPARSSAARARLRRR